MKKIACIIALLIATIYMFGARKALIIGNSAYPDQALRNASNDARAMDNTLKKLGFLTTLVSNADQMTMEDAIYTFSEGIKANDEVLFYYSGHGANVDGDNYLIPVGKTITGEKELKYWAYNANLALEKLQAAETTIFILDACRNNPYKGVRSVNKGLATMQGKAGSQYLIFSTEIGKTAEDGDSEHSPFTESFIKHIENSHDQIENIMKQVTIEVKSKTFGNQVPWTAGNLSTYFYFNKAPVTIPEESKAVVSRPNVKIGTEYHTGSVKVDSDIVGELFLDDDLLCDISPAKVINLDSLSVGEHKLELRSHDHNLVRKIVIEKNKTIYESFASKLVPDPKSSMAVKGKAKLKITAELWPIRVWLNGVLNDALGSGKEIQVSGGSHDLKIEYIGKGKENYDPWQQQVVLADQEERNVTPVFVERTYSISLISKISGFMVTVNDANQNQLLSELYSEAIHLKKGNYLFKVSKTDYLDYHFDLSVKDNTSVKVFILPRNAVNNLSPSLRVQYPESFSVTISKANSYNLVWSAVKNIDAYLIDYQTQDGSWRNGAFCLSNNTSNKSIQSLERIIAFRIYCVEAERISKANEYSFTAQTASMPDQKPLTTMHKQEMKKIASVLMIEVAGGSIVLGDLKLRTGSFLIGKYEITHSEYSDVMGNNVDMSDKYSAANRVNWFDAIEYCNRRSIIESLTPCYSYMGFGSNPDAWPKDWKKSADNRNVVYCNWDANGYRLPTETEWMYAAAGGQKTHQDKYSGGDSLHNMRAFNELGIYNMSSSLSEWCWDIYAGYPMPILDNYRGAEKGTKCVRRGSSLSEKSMRILTRSYAKVTQKEDTMGFRICRNAK